MKRVWIEGAVVLLAASSAVYGQPSLSPEDKAEIQALAAKYATALGSCDAQAFADVFVPETGYFVSGFRGQLVGRDALVALVESERHCNLAPGTQAPPRPGGNAPVVELEVTEDGVHGVANLGAVGRYEDEYVKTPDGWKIAARTVVTKAESDAGLEPSDFLEIQRLGGPDLGEYWAVNDNGVKRLRSAGVAVSVASGKVTGRAYLRDGGYYDDVYEKTADGEWRVQSRTKVPAP